MTSMGGMGVGGREAQRGIIYVYLRLIVGQQKPTHCKAIILQFKINIKKKNLSSSPAGPPNLLSYRIKKEGDTQCCSVPLGNLLTPS